MCHTTQPAQKIKANGTSHSTGVPERTCIAASPLMVWKYPEPLF
ncbi:MAG: hypothetical protein AAFQ59_17210 [Pseudomonadota bacterium]